MPRSGRGNQPMLVSLPSCRFGGTPCVPTLSESPQGKGSGQGRRSRDRSHAQAALAGEHGEDQHLDGSPRCGLVPLFRAASPKTIFKRNRLAPCKRNFDLCDKNRPIEIVGHCLGALRRFVAPFYQACGRRELRRRIDKPVQRSRERSRRNVRVFDVASPFAVAVVHAGSGLQK